MNVPYTLILGIEKARIDAAWPRMSAWAQSTFLEIQAKAVRYGNHPTSDQADLLVRLIEEAEAKAAKPVAAKVDLSKINQMFDRAAEQLKRPFVMFLVEGAEFRVSQAPATGRNPGSLYVKAGSAYAGKIAPDGAFSAAREAPKGIYEALLGFAADPVKAAHAYGMETGSCCFCARELTDARSVTVGYGPICASRWGLPWGE